jgi:Flp pilus assembly protein TadD
MAVTLHRFRGDCDRALELVRQAAQTDPSDFLLSNLTCNYLDQGMIEEARGIAEDLRPDLFDNEQVVAEFQELIDAMQAAYLLWMDAAVHAVRGDRQQAVTTLREAVEEGWRESWWLLRLAYCDVMRDSPEWNQLMDELEADIATQREWYEKHKDVAPVS